MITETETETKLFAASSVNPCEPAATPLTGPVTNSDEKRPCRNHGLLESSMFYKSDLHYKHRRCKRCTDALIKQSRMRRSPWHHLWDLFYRRVKRRYRSHPPLRWPQQGEYIVHALAQSLPDFESVDPSTLRLTWKAGARELNMNELVLQPRRRSARSARLAHSACAARAGGAEMTTSV